jgi:uncharacterized membrane protein YdbT with pleckstrin-like domain
MAKQHLKDSPTEKQKKSFKPYLAEDEELILVAGLSGAYLRQAFMIFLVWPGIIFILIGVLGAYILSVDLMMGVYFGVGLDILASIVKTFVTYHAHRYLLTTRRVIIKKGLFAVKLTVALYDKITHIEVDQSFFDKLLLHHGTLIINTAGGASNNEIVLKYLDYPIEFKNLLERLINREREHFGGKGGSVFTVEGEILD